MQARRNHPPDLASLRARLAAEGRTGLAERLCRNVTRRMNAPRFARHLEELQDARG